MPKKTTNPISLVADFIYTHVVPHEYDSCRSLARRLISRLRNRGFLKIEDDLDDKIKKLGMGIGGKIAYLPFSQEWVVDFSDEAHRHSYFCFAKTSHGVIEKAEKFKKRIVTKSQRKDRKPRSSKTKKRRASSKERRKK